MVALQVLLLEHDINTSPFTPAVHACVPPLPWSVTQADVDDPNRCADACPLLLLAKAHSCTLAVSFLVWQHPAAA